MFEISGILWLLQIIPAYSRMTSLNFRVLIFCSWCKILNCKITYSIKSKYAENHVTAVNFLEFQREIVIKGFRFRKLLFPDTVNEI